MLGMDNVRVKINEANPHIKVSSNRVSNTKFSWYSFLPRSFYEQLLFRHINRYFFFVACLQCWPAVAPVNPLTIWGPLVVLFLITAIREGIDDLRRARADRATNNMKYEVVNGSELNPTPLRKIKPGDVVCVRGGQQAPCDLVLLCTSTADGVCGLQTANIDGESTLSMRIAPEVTNKLELVRGLGKLRGVVECDLPNRDVHRFQGVLTCSGRGDRPLEHPIRIPLNLENTMFQGTVLRRCEFAYGVAVYVGKNTKLSLNKRKVKTKIARTDHVLDRITLHLFATQLALMFLIGICGFLWMRHKAPNAWYLFYENSGREEKLQLVIMLCRWFLILSLMVPISLKVTMDIVKGMFGLYIGWDLGFYDEGRELGAKVTDTAILENLGQVRYLLTDKTGTLTENNLVFKACSIGTQLYTVAGKAPAHWGPHLRRASALSSRGSVGFSADQAEAGIAGSSKLGGMHKPRDWHDGSSEIDLTRERAKSNSNRICPAIHAALENGESEVSLFFKALVVCNMATPRINETGDGESGALVFEAPSPDDEALATTAYHHGVKLLSRDRNNVYVDFCGENVSYDVVCMLPFTSARKRMSIIMREHQKKGYLLITKGADDAVLSFVRNDRVKSATETHLQTCAQAGLRTLVVSVKELTEEEYLNWEGSYVRAATTVNDREAKIEAVFREIEEGSRAIGCTAIEDSLQPEVPETIEMCRQANISVWMITGDKYETALQISITCNLASPHSVTQIHITGDTRNDIGYACERALQNMQQNREESYTIYMDGETVEYMCQDNRQTMLRLGELAATMVCYRVSPNQKAVIAELVKKQGCTLCIGDGGNDVGMIQVADFGVGMQGKEGNQAAAAADVSITRFHHLKRLLFVHGRQAYMRSGFISQFTMYKAIILVFCQIFFGICSAGSGVSLFDSFSLFGYNMFWTSLPILFYVLDRDVSQEASLRYPALYQLGQDRAYLSETSFAWWVFMAFYQAAVIFWFAFQSSWGYQSSLFHSSLDFKQFGLLVFTSAVFTQGGLLFLRSHSITVINAFVIVGSIVLFIFCETGISFVPMTASFMAYTYLLCDPRFYLIVILSVTVALLPVVLFGHFKYDLSPGTLEIAQRLDRSGPEQELLRMGVSFVNESSRRTREGSMPLLDQSSLTAAEV